MRRIVRRIKRRLTLWFCGTGQCRQYRTEPMPFQHRGKWMVGFGTSYCLKRRGHFGGHTIDW